MQPVHQQHPEGIRPPGIVVGRTNLAFLLPICLVAALGGLLFGYDTGVISGAIEPLTIRFQLDDVMKGWASGCVLIGCATGVLLAGPVSDRLGRRFAMFSSAVMFLVSAIGAALPHDIRTFIFFRIIGGLGIGIASISTPMYIAEITPARLRGRMVSVNQIAIVGGITATAFINYFIARAMGNPSQPEVQAWLVSTGWRWMFAAGVVPAVLFGLLLIPMPESPRWLIEKKREERARRILERIGGPEFADDESRNVRAALSNESGSWGELFSAKLRRPLVIGVLLAVLQQVTGINVFLYFGATIFKTISARAGVDAGLLTQIVINGTGVIFTLIAIATIDKWGRKPLMLLGAAGMGASLFAMGMMAQVVNNPAMVSDWMLAFIILYIACFGLSVGPVTWVILSEIFPTAVRGRALGLAAFFLWLADYVVIQTFPVMDAQDSFLVKQFHHAFPFYVYAVFCIALVAVMAAFVPETRGKSLEEIEGQWKSRLSA
ncbi:MAG TPA: sugar porter family MFS transporter [Verrucomicrobiae bacterium]|jgi:sugar porter (SP) family MFS transporter